MRYPYMLSALAAGCLWGLIGVFSRLLGGFGFSPLQIVICRSGTAAALFFLSIVISDVRLLRFELKDIWCFLGAGVLGMLFFSACYFTAVELIGIPTAAILQYTSPAIVAVLSIFVFHEKLSAWRILAVALSFSGCCVISLAGGSLSFSLLGLLCGLGAGLGYALQSIFASIAVRKGYTSLTVNFYISLFAATGAILLDRGQMAELSPLPAEVLLLVVAAGSIASFLPSWLYVKSLSAMEASRASVMASTEPIAATAFGVVLFNDPLDPAIIVGAVLILAAVAVSARPDPHPPLDKHPPA